MAQEGEFIVKNTEEIEAQKPLILFGKDIREIKCFRLSFTYGICLGFVGGLASFLFTSKAIFSTNVAFASLWVGVLGYWIPCRYKYETNMLIYDSLKRQKMERNLMEKQKESDNTES